jgi:hypothetical protein
MRLTCTSSRYSVRSWTRIRLGAPCLDKSLRFTQRRGTSSLTDDCLYPHHRFSGFVNPQRLRLMMHEKGVVSHYEEVALDMKSGEQRGWQHLKRNPWGEAPTLELEDGSTLSEAAAIASYIDDSHPGRKIMGETPLERALDQQWDNRVWVHLLYRLTVAFHVLVRRLHFKLALHPRFVIIGRARPSTVYITRSLYLCVPFPYSSRDRTRVWVQSSSSRLILNGASTAVKKPSPLPRCSTSTCLTAGPGCSADRNPRSVIRLFASQSRWAEAERPALTSPTASSSSISIGKGGRRGRVSR